MVPDVGRDSCTVQQIEKKEKEEHEGAILEDIWASADTIRSSYLCN